MSLRTLVTEKLLDIDTSMQCIYPIIGACNYIEREAIGRAVMWWPCLHHVLEIVLKAVVESRWPTSGPCEALFLRFQKEWPTIREKMPEIEANAKEKVGTTNGSINEAWCREGTFTSIVFLWFR